MALGKTKDTRALCMAAIIVVMAMAVSSPCAVASSLWCGQVPKCTIEKCRFACNVHGYGNPLFIKCYAQPESDLTGPNNCCCLGAQVERGRQADAAATSGRGRKRQVRTGTDAFGPSSRKAGRGCAAGPVCAHASDPGRGSARGDGSAVHAAATLGGWWPAS